jgi:hypothetical protein
MSATELKIVWSKKEGDFLIHYPRPEDGRLINNKLIAERLEWGGVEGRDKGWLNYETFNLIDELEKRGYDIKTLKFSVMLK